MESNAITLRYKDAEAIIAYLVGVKANGMGSFRAKLRHLRNIGLPNIPGPGSGQSIAYTQRHIFEMFLAVELEMAGHAPSRAAMLAQSIARRTPPKEIQDTDLYVITDARKANFLEAREPDALLEAIVKAGDIFVIINASGCLRRLHAAIERFASGA
jgi:hypothetical protein